MTFKMPEPPVIAAGALGGPFCVYATTPIRNALTIAASNKALTTVGCYRQAFGMGFTGGHYFAVAACPQFVCLGPLFHVYASGLGASAGVTLAGLTESLIVHGAEKRNAQASINRQTEGRIPAHRMQNPYMPLGPGFGLHATRNVSAMVGMRVLCDPITRMYEKLAGGKSQAVTLAGDMSANVVSACISMPIHQLWNYTVSTPEMWDKPTGERLNMMTGYLRNQYLTTTESGSTRISSVILRDALLRSVYIAVIYTAFVNIERASVKYWPF